MVVTKDWLFNRCTVCAVIRLNFRRADSPQTHASSPYPLRCHQAARRFLQLGLAFGGHGGFDAVHQMVLLACNDLETFGTLSYRCLSEIQDYQGFDRNVLYAVLHEPIYCENRASRWSAEREIDRHPEFTVPTEWPEDIDDIEGDPIYFTGEMIFSWMFQDYAELRPLKDVAYALAQREDWGRLYDKDRLRSNTVPVAGVSYYDDMYVDLQLSTYTVEGIKGFRHWITNEYLHNGIRENGEHILNYLFSLIRGDLDL